MKEDLSAIRNVLTVRAIARDCVEDKSVLDYVLTVLKKEGDSRAGLNASWILSTASEKHPEIFSVKQMELIMKALSVAKTGTLKRNLIRIFQFVKMKGERGLEIIDMAFALYSNPEEDLAVRVFSITVLETHLDLLPEIAGEVEFIAEKEAGKMSPSFAFRLKKFRKKAGSLKAGW